MNREYREMEYGKERYVTLLDSGKCLEFEYFILNLGTHPTAYVKIPKNHKLFHKTYNDMWDENIEINVHGGITYSKDNLIICPLNTKEDWFIGWDYTHCDDYSGYDIRFTDIIIEPRKKWTTEEIQNDVYNVCLQLRELERK